MPGLASAQTDTSTPPKKPAPTTASAAKTEHSISAPAITKHTSSGTSAQKTKSAHSKTASSKTGSNRTGAKNKGSKNLKTAKKRGQQVIDRDRARAIQEALIREHYMQGEPSGSWDSATQAAMQRYQADQGWQAKTIPDSRALIKLGLGPSHDHLLNPESAMTSADPKTGPKSNPADAASPRSSPNDRPQR